MNKIATAANTVVPALLALERLGFTLSIGSLVTAKRDAEEYVADDPVALLGLIKLIELRSWDWKPTDEEIDDVMKRYALGG